MTILIADDHYLILDGLKKAVQDSYSDAVVLTATHKAELDLLLNSQEVDLLVLDVKFGKDNAKVFIAQLKRTYPDLKILILTSLDDQYSIQLFVNAKVDGYVVKSDSIVDILNAIAKILDGQKYFSAEVDAKMNEKEMNEIFLTKREKEVLKVILEEKSIKEIASILNISDKTVEMHRSNLFAKLGVKNITGLVKKAILLNLTEN